MTKTEMIDELLEVQLACFHAHAELEDDSSKYNAILHKKLNLIVSKLKSESEKLAELLMKDKIKNLGIIK